MRDGYMGTRMRCGEQKGWKNVEQAHANDAREMPPHGDAQQAERANISSATDNEQDVMERRRMRRWRVEGDVLLEKLKR